MKRLTNEWNEIKAYAADDEAIGVVEIILILVVLIALVLIFKDQITKVVNDAFKSFNEDSSEIIG
ncbi:MAG: hypothetical protein J6P16_07175 [Eubacterium sp.]|nr:hypothetical protein [Eubacterium sp.]